MFDNFKTMLLQGVPPRAVRQKMIANRILLSGLIAFSESTLLLRKRMPAFNGKAKEGQITAAGKVWDGKQRDKKTESGIITISRPVKRCG